MKLFILFGLPGAGKTYVGKVAEKYFGYHLYDGDVDLTDEMQYAIEHQLPITDDMRDIFFQKLLQSVAGLEKKYEKVVVTQTFIKEKYRKQFQEAFPQAAFVLIVADQQLQETRILNRKEYNLAVPYARKMTNIFDVPEIKHETIVNNRGEEEVRKQLQEILI